MKALSVFDRGKEDIVGRMDCMGSTRLEGVRVKLLPFRAEVLNPWLFERKKARIRTEKGRWGGGEGERERETVCSDRNDDEQGGGRQVILLALQFHSRSIKLSLCTIVSCMRKSLGWRYMI